MTKVGLILGAAVWPGGRPSPTLRRRVAEASRLYHAGEIDAVICSGGLGAHPPSEAALMARLLTDAGVPLDAIHQEGAATNTIENIAFSLPILRRLGARDVLLISDAYHLPRARATARLLGLYAKGSATPFKGTHPRSFLKASLRECGALAILPARIPAILRLRGEVNRRGVAGVADTAPDGLDQQKRS
ncbi:YdcF family protein [Paracoccaceae bacterium GXU_MW_L88]